MSKSSSAKRRLVVGLLLFLFTAGLGTFGFHVYQKSRDQLLKSLEPPIDEVVRRPTPDVSEMWNWSVSRRFVMCVSSFTTDGRETIEVLIRGNGKAQIRDESTTARPLYHSVDINKPWLNDMMRRVAEIPPCLPDSGLFRIYAAGRPPLFRMCDVPWHFVHELRRSLLEQGGPVVPYLPDRLELSVGAADDADRIHRWPLALISLEQVVTKGLVFTDHPDTNRLIRDKWPDPPCFRFRDRVVRVNVAWRPMD